MNDTPGSDLLRADHRRIETYLDSLILALKPVHGEFVESSRDRR